MFADIDKLCRPQIISYRFAYTITMYEVTVSVNNEQKYLLDYISESMHDYVDKIDGTCISLQQKRRSYFSLACSDTFRLQAKRLIEEQVARVLSLGYKNLFVRQLLNVCEGNFYQNVLLNTICLFDHQYDAKMMESIIDSTNDIYIDGYYNFRIKDFKRKWESVINMLLENSYILTDNSLVVEFLQYLLQSVDVKTKQLSICLENDKYTLFDGKGKLIAQSLTLSPTVTPEGEAIVNAICLNPQTLKVYHGSTLSKDFCDITKALFDVEFVATQ